MKKSRVNITCATCGTVFEVQSYRSKIARFCGDGCYRQWRNGRVFGKVKLSPETTAKEYLSGKSADDLADKYSVTREAIYYHLRKQGVKPRGPDSNMLKQADIQDAARKANSQRRGKLNHKFIELPVDEIVKQYAQGNSLMAIAKQYGVTDNAIASRLKGAGIKMRRAGFSRKRKCPDGHIADSQWEYAVDCWLHEHGIEHEIHPTVPWYKGGRSPQRSDFRVGDAYIEVWGIINNLSYNQKRLEKTANYKLLNIQLIEIFPHHILSNDLSPLEILLK